jgi:hypothetical protein
MRPCPQETTNKSQQGANHHKNMTGWYHHQEVGYPQIMDGTGERAAATGS